MIEQITGRTGNRWDFSVIGKLYIVLDNRKTELFIYKETNSWEKYYSKYIEQMLNSQTHRLQSFYLTRRFPSDNADFPKRKDSLKVQSQKKWRFQHFHR